MKTLIAFLICVFTTQLIFAQQKQQPVPGQKPMDSATLATYTKQQKAQDSLAKSKEIINQDKLTPEQQAEQKRNKEAQDQNQKIQSMEYEKQKGMPGNAQQIGRGQDPTPWKREGEPEKSSKQKKPKGSKEKQPKSIIKNYKVRPKAKSE